MMNWLQTPILFQGISWKWLFLPYLSYINIYTNIRLLIVLEKKHSSYIIKVDIV